MTKPSGELSSGWQKQFIDRYCSQSPNDWVRLDPIRIQEPFEFIQDEINRAKREAEIKTAERLRMGEKTGYSAYGGDDAPWKLVLETGKHEGYNKAVKELNTKINQIINQSENK